MDNSFNPVRAAFYLVAGVIAAHVVFVALTLIACLIVYVHTGGAKDCSAGEKLMEALAAALAAALAFAGGKTQK